VVQFFIVTSIFFSVDLRFASISLCDTATIAKTIVRRVAAQVTQFYALFSLLKYASAYLSGDSISGALALLNLAGKVTISCPLKFWPELRYALAASLRSAIFVENQKES
jgi:hypothetical protein